jgi:hypothetical protein
MISLGEGICAVAEVPGRSAPTAEGQRVRDLLRRCAATSDPAERAALLGQVAYELNTAAAEIAANAGDRGGEVGELVAALQGQAGMAGFMAELERSDWARHVERVSPGQPVSFTG